MLQRPNAEKLVVGTRYKVRPPPVLFLDLVSPHIPLHNQQCSPCALILKGAELLRTWLTLDLALCLCDHRFDLRGWHVHKMT